MQSQLQHEFAYQNKILQGVSRTFALTIPQLPSKLGDVVGNAYLLCRIADTIEDDAQLASDLKRKFSEQFIDVVEGNIPAKVFSESLHPQLAEQTIDAEKDLIANTDKVIRISHSFNGKQQAALSRCIRIMAKGMADYQDKESPDGLPDQRAMDEYCYYVAGVVGEMLTELFCDYSKEINQHYAQMMSLSTSFGQGLQMTNILKDIWDDQQRGACWLPRETFERHGFDLRKLRPGSQNSQFQSGLGELVSIARAHLQNALDYTLLIPAHEPGIRKFCLWAIGMAVLTLNKINNNRDFSSGAQVKISRNSVKTTIFVTNLLVKSDKSLKLLFNFTSKSLPQHTIHEKIPA